MGFDQAADTKHMITSQTNRSPCNGYVERLNYKFIIIKLYLQKQTGQS
jgi:hypothetical protein